MTFFCAGPQAPQRSFVPLAVRRSKMPGTTSVGLAWHTRRIDSLVNAAGSPTASHRLFNSDPADSNAGARWHYFGNAELGIEIPSKSGQPLTKALSIRLSIAGFCAVRNIGARATGTHWPERRHDDARPDRHGGNDASPYIRDRVDAARHVVFDPMQPPNVFAAGASRRQCRKTQATAEAAAGTLDLCCQ